MSYNYGAKQALIDVSFDVPKGAFCALLGPNGAGKSTLFNLLTRLFVAPQGDIVVGGESLKLSPRAALSKLGIVFQQPTLDLDLTVKQNLLYFAALHGISGHAARQKINACLERLKMAERADEKVRSLNGGHRRRTEIARALVPNPEVLLLDEPTVGLDAASRSMITDHVHALAKSGTTVLWATHLTDEIDDSDYVVVLHQARVMQTGSAYDIRGAQTLKDRFLEMTRTPA